MIQVKRRCNAGAVFALVLLMLALSIHAIASPSNALPVVTHTIPTTTAPQTPLSAAHTDSAFPVGAVSFSGIVRFLIAQSDIPDVLVPSVVPSAEPTFPQNTPIPTPQARVSTNMSKNTAQNSTGNSFDLSKIVGSISPFFIIALVPLLFVIGTLFYFFFMGDQERRVSDEDQEAEAELSNAGEETGWREL
jgi:Na+/H+ antiporter NhaC